MPEQHYGFLQELVQTSSLSAHESSALDLINTHLQNEGVESFQQGPNILAHIEGRNRKKAIVFDGHVDTVETALEAWTVCPPFGDESGVISDGKLYGAGSSDMKAGLFVMSELLKQYKQMPPACDVWAAFVVEEETTGKGTSAFVDWFKTAAADKYNNVGVLFPESTGIENMYIGQKGNAIFDASIVGSGGHAARHTGDNVVVRMSEYIAALNENAKDWSLQYPNELFGVPKFTTTAIQAGNLNSPNAVAEECIASIDVRLNPEIQDYYEELMTELANEYNIKLHMRWTAAPAVSSDPNGDLVSVVKQISKVNPRIMDSTSDAGWFLNNGFNQAILYGPGNPRVIHKPNEYVKLQDIDHVREVYSQVVETWGSK